MSFFGFIILGKKVVKKYVDSFFLNFGLDRGHLEQNCQIISRRENFSKYYFFMYCLL